MGLLDGKKVLITGARKGIGRGIAITLANEGADVGINDILDDEFAKKLLEIISNKRVNATFHQGDVSSIEGINSVFDLLLKKPINNLEKYEDKDLIWRRYVNQKLKTEYKKLFAMIDYFIFMKIPNFNKVFKWRLIQERKLRKRSHKAKKIMLYNEIKRFIMFYERITLQMLKDMPKIASIVLSLNDKHQINKIRFKN